MLLLKRKDNYSVYQGCLKIDERDHFILASVLPNGVMEVTTTVIMKDGTIVNIFDSNILSKVKQHVTNYLNRNLQAKPVNLKQVL